MILQIIFISGQYKLKLKIKQGIIKSLSYHFIWSEFQISMSGTS